MADLSRRHFLQASGLAAGLVAGGSVRWLARPAVPDLSFRDASIALWDSLSPEQREMVARPWEHPARQVVNHIACIDVPRVAQVLSPTQRALVHRIYETTTSDAYRRRFGRLVGLEGGGLDPCELVLYGDPRTESFQVALYGGHLLVRAGGITGEGSAFGGPIGYGHQVGNGVPRLPGNAFDHHLEAANVFFDTLDDGQRSLALVPGEPPSERLVQLQGWHGVFPGLALSGLSDSKLQGMDGLLGAVLSCYDEGDQQAARGCIERNGGLDALSVAFYAERGYYDDGTAWSETDEAERARRGSPCWHDWRIEGPGTAIHFRGWPHPHGSIHVADDAGARQNVGEVLLVSGRRFEGDALRALLWDAMRQASQAPLAFVRELSARILPGQVTTGVAWTLDPFGDDLRVATVTGAGASEELRRQVESQGGKLEDDAEYRVAVSSFDLEVAGGLGDVRQAESTGLRLRDVYEAYLRQHGVGRAG